jgi:hypothetical protein
MPKSQTATEYLIIGAVVIIIAIIVVTVLGGIPGIGGGSSEKQSRLALQTADVGVLFYAVGNEFTTLTIRNNGAQNILVSEIVINGIVCDGLSSVRLDIGQQFLVTCSNVFATTETSVSWPISIAFTQIVSQAAFNQSSDIYRLVGQVASEISGGQSYLDLLRLNEYWIEENDGCFDSNVDPIPICTCVDLNLITTNLFYNFEQQNNIDFVRCATTFGADYMTGAGWLPIGVSGNGFLGTYNGSSYTISNLFINRPVTNNVGLFGFVGQQYPPFALITNVYLENVDVTGSNSVGGLVGTTYSFSEIVNSYVGGSVSGTNFVGGLIGYAIDYVSISNSYTTGSVSGADVVGGLVGISKTFSPISNSHSTSSVSGTNAVGGLIGYIQYNSEVSNSYAAGSVTGTNNIGGLVGFAAFDSDVSDSYATGSVTGTSSVGGLVGYAIEQSDISNSYATGNVISSSNAAGGLVGAVLGMFGGYASISNSYATGSVTGTSETGGLAGFVVDGIRITNSFANGAVIGTSNVGGLVGHVLTSNNDESEFINIYATGSATGTENVGGLIGYLLAFEYSNSEIINAYATGLVTGDDQVGGLIGNIVTIGYYIDTQITNSYWNTETTEQGSSSGGGSARNTAQMKQQLTFSGWNFGSIWSISESTSYPYLQSIPQSPLPGISD